MEEQVILVDENDRVLGSMAKLEAHKKGVLHRAFSIFLFNSNGELLLQKRALTKYHSAGLWTNTCCSHPRPNESTDDAATRRLSEEMGLVVPLTYKTNFVYKAKFDNNLTEHEFDHVYTGVTDLNPALNTDEVDSYKWLSLPDVKSQIKSEPDSFTVWFKIAIERLF